MYTFIIKYTDPHTGNQKSEEYDFTWEEMLSFCYGLMSAGMIQVFAEEIKYQGEEC